VHLSTAVVSGKIATFGLDAALNVGGGTFSFSAHSGDALAVDPHAGTAYISTTGGGGGYASSGGGLSEGITATSGTIKGIGVTQLQNDPGSPVFSGAGGAEFGAGVSTELDGNRTCSAGQVEGFSTSSGVDATKGENFSVPGRIARLIFLS
jgi:hypothetical protein